MKGMFYRNSEHEVVAYANPANGRMVDRRSIVNPRHLRFAIINKRVGSTSEMAIIKTPPGLNGFSDRRPLLELTALIWCGTPHRRAPALRGELW